MSQIFVFGSNKEGRHGAGAALLAYECYGAVLGKPSGRQGNSYAIITKELRKDKKPVSLDEVSRGVHQFLLYAANHLELDFIVSPIGCGLADFIPQQIAPLFRKHTSNVHLPRCFTKVLIENGMETQDILGITEEEKTRWKRKKRGF